jgi:Protein of unknown function (DUF2730)
MPFTYDWTVNLSLLLTTGALIYTWWRTRDQNTDGRFKAGSDRMDRHEARLNSMEQTLRGLPAVKDMHDLQISITALNGKLETLSAVIEGRNQMMERLEAIVSRHDNHLLKS